MTVYKYPACGLYGLRITPASPKGIDHITWSQIRALHRPVCDYVLKGLDRQTTAIDGPYPWDVEKLLIRYEFRLALHDCEGKEPHGTDA